MKYEYSPWAFDRTRNTFFAHEGKLYQVVDFHEREALLLGSQNARISVPFRDLDLTPIPNGYVNTEVSSSFWCRVPLRRDWRQGARRENFSANAVGPFEFQDTFTMYHLEQPLANNYPSFNDALDLVEEQKHSCAFSRSFSVTEEGGINYKGRARVGQVNDSQSIRLNDDFYYLQEVLREDLRNENVTVNTGV